MHGTLSDAVHNMHAENTKSHAGMCLGMAAVTHESMFVMLLADGNQA